MQSQAPEPPSLSVVIPVFNDEEVLGKLYDRLRPVLEGLTDRFEVIFVDDGSRDRSIAVLQALRDGDDRIAILRLIRNFGQMNAIAAGFDHARYDTVVVMDSDLQDPPEFIPSLIAAMDREGTDMAIARWTERRDSIFKILASHLFHFVVTHITTVELKPRLGVFRAIRREVLDRTTLFCETTASVLSLIQWMGAPYSIVDLKRDERQGGRSGYTLSKMMKIALDRIFSYSLVPIRMAAFFGVVLGLSAFLLGFYLVVRRVFFEGIVEGWTSLAVLTLFLFGITLFFLGVIGEYLGRIYEETRYRPRYIVADRHGDVRQYRHRSKG